MKYLKIDHGKGYFLLNGTEWIQIDQINKENILELLNICLSQDFEMDEFDKEKIANQAHQIIYKHIYEKFEDLKNNRNRFQDESESIYKTALEKYGS